MGERENSPKERASWIGVNAYGVFIGVLVILISVQYALGPSGHVLSAVGHVAYFFAGLGLLHSYWRANVVAEVFASVLLLGGNLAILASRVLTSDERANAFTFAVAAALAFAVAARTLALMRGGTFVLPKWRA